jgi:hypothetical protein
MQVGAAPERKKLMPVRRDERGRWIFRHVVLMAPDEDGVRAKRRIYGTAPRHDNTKAAAEREMLEAIDRLLCPERYVVAESVERKEVETFREFVEKRFLPYSEDKNKHSEVLSKKSILERHLVPFFGEMRLDAVRALQIEDYKREKLRGGRVFQGPAVKTGEAKEPGCRGRRSTTTSSCCGECCGWRRSGSSSRTRRGPSCTGRGM